ncbi:ATP-binding protein [Streptomyces avermitilis]|uniref:ATP-binding protein n=1 Tax=Streptomyces avermitilis TaxID=33903 RepID=UPI003F53E7A9
MSLTAGFAAGGRAEGLATGAALDGEDGLAGRAASVHGVGDLAGVGLVRRLGRSLPPSRHRRWATAFGDATVAAAMLDRLLHRAAVAGIDGPSYRLRGHQNQAATIRAGVNARVSCHPRHHRGRTRDSTSLPFAYEILHAVGGLRRSARKPSASRTANAAVLRPGAARPPRGWRPGRRRGRVAGVPSVPPGLVVGNDRALVRVDDVAAAGCQGFGTVAQGAWCQPVRGRNFPPLQPGGGRDELGVANL